MTHASSAAGASAKVSGSGKDPVGLLFAGGAGSVIGVLPALIAPIYSVWLANEHHFSNPEIGLIQSSLHLVQVVVILAMSPIVDRFNRRVLGIVGALIGAVGYLLIAVSSGFWMMFAVQFVAGFGAGLAYVGATSALSYARKPARAFSIITIVAILVGAVTLILFPALSSWSPQYGLFVGLALVILVCLFGFIKMPDVEKLPVVAEVRDATAEALAGIAEAGELTAATESTDDALDTKRRSVFAFPGFAVVIAYFLVNLGLVAVWTFSAQIGVDAGMTDTESPVFLGISQIMCIVGVVLAWWVADKPFALPVLVTSIAVLAMGKLVLGMGLLATFAIGMLITNLAFYCVIPYMFAAGSQLDPRSGRLVVMVGASAMVASAIGPTVGGYLAGSTDNWFRLTVVAAIVIAAAIPFAVIGVRAGLKAAARS